MEDDIRKREDDPRKTRNQESTAKDPGIVPPPPPPRMVADMENDDPPPPPRHGCPCPYPNKDGVGGLDNAGQLPSLYGNDGLAGNSQPRAKDIPVLSGGNVGKDENAFGSRKLTGCITINGVSLMDVMKKKTTKKITDVKNSTSGRNTPKNKKKTTPLTPSSGTITKYLVKNKVGNASNENCNVKTTTREDNIVSSKEDMVIRCITSHTTKKKNIDTEDQTVRKKTTFTTVLTDRRRNIKENIRMFQELEKGHECVIQGGMCSTHNVKLLRNVTEKKMSVKNEDGSVVWKMGEVVTLTCPLKQSIRMNSAIVTSPLMTDGPTGIKRFCVREDMDQSALGKFRREDL